MTRQTSRLSLGRSSSKASKPSALETRPAREAKRSANSSKRSRGTVMALILTMLTREILRRGSRGRAALALAGLPDDEPGPHLLRAEHARAAEALGLRHAGLDVVDLDVERHVAVV